MTDTANVLDKFERQLVTYYVDQDPRTGKDIEETRPAFVYNGFALLHIDDHWIILHVPTKTFAAVNQGAVFHRIDDAANFVVDLLASPDWEMFAKEPGEASKAPKEFCDRIYELAKKNNACKGHLEHYASPPEESVKKLLAAIFGEDMVKEALKQNEEEISFVGAFIEEHFPEILTKHKLSPRDAAIDTMKARVNIQKQYERQYGRPMSQKARVLLGITFFAGTDFKVIKKETK